MAGEREAEHLIAREHARKQIGFRPPVRSAPGVTAAQVERVVAAAVEKAVADASARIKSAGAKPALPPVDIEGQWRGSGGAELRKSASRNWWLEHERAAQREHDRVRDMGAAEHIAHIHRSSGTVEGTGQRVGLAKRAPGPSGQLLKDEGAEIDQLAAARQAGGDVSAGHIEERRRFVSALKTAPTAVLWQPHQGDVAAGDGVAELGRLGGARSPEEIAAAAREAANGSTAWADRLLDASVADLVKAAPRLPMHVVGRAGFRS